MSVVEGASATPLSVIIAHDIANIMDDMRLYRYAELSNVEENLRREVGIISILDYNRVILEIDGVHTDLETFTKISTDIQEHALEQPMLKRVRVGAPCIAQFSEDKMWYRAQIYEVLKEDKVKVWFVDFGNFDDVLLDNVRDIHTDWLSYPLQHYPATLANVELKDENKMDEVLQFMDRFCSTIQIAYIVCVNPLRVTLYDKESEKLLYQDLIDSGLLHLQVDAA